MTPLPRGTCPVCGADVALREGKLVREHRAAAGSAAAVNKWGKCQGSGRFARERAS